MSLPNVRSYSPPTAAVASAEQAAFMSKVYGYMAGGLTLTALAAFLVASSPTARGIILGNPIVFFGLIIAELVLVFSFSRVARSVSASGAASMFFLYSVLNGLTLSVIFLAYTHASIATTFLVTAGTFGGISLFGYVTKKDLTGVGSFMMMGLWGLILASVVNIFLHSPMIYWITTYMGVFIFVGLTAYDTQKIKEYYWEGGGEDAQKGAIHGALILYLDFINLFLFLLRLFGRRR